MAKPKLTSFRNNPMKDVASAFLPKKPKPESATSEEPKEKPSPKREDPPDEDFYADATEHLEEEDDASEIEDVASRKPRPTYDDLWSKEKFYIAPYQSTELRCLADMKRIKINVLLRKILKDHFEKPNVKRAYAAYKRQFPKKHKALWDKYEKNRPSPEEYEDEE